MYKCSTDTITRQKALTWKISIFPRLARCGTAIPKLASQSWTTVSQKNAHIRYTRTKTLVYYFIVWQRLTTLASICHRQILKGNRIESTLQVSIGTYFRTKNLWWSSWDSAFLLQTLPCLDNSSIQVSLEMVASSSILWSLGTRYKFGCLEFSSILHNESLLSECNWAPIWERHEET